MKKRIIIEKPETEYLKVYQEAKKCNITDEKFKKIFLEKAMIICGIVLFATTFANMILDVFFSVKINPGSFSNSLFGALLFIMGNMMYQNRITPILKEEIAKAKYGKPMEV
jgi:hypothetical protein